MQARVLVVEDVPALRRLFAMAMELGGCSVFGAEHLDAAMEVARFHPPDVMVIDERVIRAAPDAFRGMRSQRGLRDLLVVALSAGVQRRRQLIDLGVHAVVGKPVKDRALVAAVRWVLDVYRGRDALRGVG